jgi:polar amino acid transport system substrate-binding protein
MESLLELSILFQVSNELTAAEAKREHAMKVVVSAAIAALTISFACASFAQQPLRAGSTTAGQPMSGINPQTKEFEGVAVELLRAVVKDAGMEVQFVPMNFAELQPALNDNKIEIIAASYGITPARLKLVDFTEPYGAYRDVLIVRVDDLKAYRSTADFKGMSIAIPKGSSYVGALKEAGANLTLVNTPPEAISELEAGHVAGVVDNGLQLTYQLRNNAHPSLKIVDSYQPIQEAKLAFAVRKGANDLLDKLNPSLKKLQDNGTVKAIYDKWGLK